MSYKHAHDAQGQVGTKNPLVNKNWLRAGYPENKPNMEEWNRNKVTALCFGNPAPPVFASASANLSSGNLGYYGIWHYTHVGGTRTDFTDGPGEARFLAPATESAATTIAVVYDKEETLTLNHPSDFVGSDQSEERQERKD